MRYQGKIVEWNAEKAFGFVLPNAGGRKVFIHLNEFPNRRAPVVGALVTFEIGLDANRRSCAVRAQFVRSPHVRRAREDAHEARAAWGQLSLWLAGAWTLLVIGLALMNTYPWKFFAAWLMVNSITFLLYVWDKKAAERGDQRTPEARLHFFALAGGWPAAALAQQWLRHKTSKQSFRSVFWICVLANVCVMLWLTSKYASNFLAVFR